MLFLSNPCFGTSQEALPSPSVLNKAGDITRMGPNWHELFRAAGEAAAHPAGP